MALLCASHVSRIISTYPFPSSKNSFLPQNPSPLPLLPASPLKPPALATRSRALFIKPATSPPAAGTESYFSLNHGEDLEAAGDVDEGSPWEGAVVYRRDPKTTHLEYATTLDRLGLGKLSSELSRMKAADMGIRVVLPRRRKEGDQVEVESTPVLISVDVTKKRRKLQLDGIVKTVITLACNRCAQPAVEAIFSNFTLLLTEDPVDETDEVIMGTIYGDDKSRCSTSGLGGDDEDESFIDLDDRLHFPYEKSEIDISKHIRDLVHVEITINAICDAGCKGMCLKCGTNLNKRSCNCGSKVEQDDGEFGPLKTLKKKMQKR